jgi:hypothetical protein
MFSNLLNPRHLTIARVEHRHSSRQCSFLIRGRAIENIVNEAGPLVLVSRAAMPRYISFNNGGSFPGEAARFRALKLLQRITSPPSATKPEAAGRRNGAKHSPWKIIRNPLRVARCGIFEAPKMRRGSIFRERRQRRCRYFPDHLNDRRIPPVELALRTPR